MSASREVATLLLAMADFAVLAPELVASELRPLVVSLEARRRTCGHCGRVWVGKALRPGARFCNDLCRVRAHRNGSEPIPVACAENR